MLTIFYNNISVHKLGMWIRFRSMIERIFSSDDAPDALLLGNYRIGKDLDWDAILVVGKEVIIFEFKPIHTKRVIITNKRWADDRGDTIFPGKRAETPFLQMRHKRNILKSIIFQHGIDYIKTVVLFPDDFELCNYSRKPDLSTRPWFQISSLNKVPELIQKNLENPCDNDEDTMTEMMAYFLRNNSKYLLRSNDNNLNLNHHGTIDFSESQTA